MKLRAFTNAPARAARNAFTLLEVILAVVIAAGLLMVALSFYHRSAELRARLIEESERLMTIRLLMDRLSGDLRTAFAEPRQGFSGGSDTMKFVRAGSPSAANLADGGLKLVTYGVVTNTDLITTNFVVIGFNRLETPLVEMKLASTNREALSFHGEMDLAAAMTHRVAEPLTRAIRFARFRYFDGAAWREAWEGVDLPLAVEATFGIEPQPAEEDIYPYEVFRRVIFVPGGRAPENSEDYLFPFDFEAMEGAP